MVSDRRQYRILGVIGKGGFGTVYKAELVGEGGFSKIVALKALNPDVAHVDEVASRLRDEARVLGLVSHRAIVEVDALVELEGRWTIVMEFVDGVDIKHLLQAVGSVPAGPALEIVQEVASALRVALTTPGPEGGALGLLHRDIKPSNIQLTPIGEVKVLDFGTARANFASREAKTRDLSFGTIEYMSPERLDFEDSAGGDVYALGSVLCEMLTGERLGRTSPRPERHAEVEGRASEAMATRGIPSGVRGLVLEMLRFDEHDRPDIADVERRSRALRPDVPGPWLADWAAEHLPAALAHRAALGADEYTGKVLTEGSSARRRREAAEATPVTTWVAPGPTRAAPRSRPRWLLPVVVLGVVAITAVLVGSGVIATLFLGGESETPAPLPPPTVVGAPEPQSEPESELEPETEPSPEPATRPGLAAPPSPSPPQRPAEPPTRPTAEPTRNGTVRVSGDATRVALEAGGRRHGPGELSPGTYVVVATFPGRGEVRVGTLTLREGQVARIDCRAAFARCTIQ